MVSDTWPKSSPFWHAIFPKLPGGVLGLFHYMNRIIKTLRENHQDYYAAIQDLQNSTYEINQEDELKLYTALKDGTLNGKQHTDDDIATMKQSKQWNKQYSQYLRKVIRPAAVIQTKLTEFKNKYKITASEGKAPGMGRLDKKQTNPSLQLIHIWQ